MNGRYAVAFAFFLLLASPACRRDASSGADVPALLADLTEQIRSSPKYPYANRLRASILARRLTGMPYDVQVGDRYDYSHELLKAGEIERCIVETERYLQAAFPDGRITFVNRSYYELLALAYLRLGEQENCLDRHSSESCLIPIAGEGVHRLRSGSLRAIDLYRRLLSDRPDDLESRWLLNLAYMTLGEYPAGVPDSLLIPPSVFDSEYPLPRFPDIAPRLGVDVRGHAGGCSMDDFDGDGRLDIFTTSYILGEPARLFLNREGQPFQEVTRPAGLRGITGGLNNTHADYDNDGDLDIFITRGAWLGADGRLPNSLLRNRGDGAFDDVTREAGVLTFAPSQVSAWADFDGDGRLDLFVGSESMPGAPFPSELYRNRGDGSFENVSAELGIELEALVKGAAWGDINNDGRPDLYVSVLGGPNRLYVNRGEAAPGGRRFEQIATAAGVVQPINSFPAWFFDFDNDGWEDIFVAGYEPGKEAGVAVNTLADMLGLPHREVTPRLYRNNRDETFTDVTREVRLDRVVYPMGANFGDFDGDGWLDLYLATGDFSLWSVVPNRAYRNAGGKVFQDVTTAGGFGQIQKGHGVAFGDFDGDGDEDVFTVTGGAVEGDVYYSLLFENPGGPNRWITLRLEGRRSNRSAIGARVRLVLRQPDGQRRELFRTVGTGGSFGANSLQLEVGLGITAQVDTVEVHWPLPDARPQVWTNLAAGRTYRLIEGEPAPK